MARKRGLPLTTTKETRPHAETRQEVRERTQAVRSLQGLPIGEAADLLKKIAYAKFNETVDLDLRLGVDPRHADQQVRGTVSLPHGTGKTVRVAVFAKGDKATEAEAAGADIVGAEDLVAKIQGGWTDFDAAIATPDMMREVGKLGKVLGPRGLMPNPKTGTVTMDVAKAVKEIKAGKVEFRVDKTANRPCALSARSSSPHSRWPRTRRPCSTRCSAQSRPPPRASTCAAFPSAAR